MSLARARRYYLAVMFDHVSIGVSDLDRSAKFYEPLLAALGHVVLNRGPRAVCFGPPGFRGEPPFAILQRLDQATLVGARQHFAFAAPHREAVQRFFEAALTHGGRDDGSPGIRENYGPGYYAAFVLDPDGHRLEAVVHEATAPS